MDCLVCRELDGDVDLPGGMIAEDELAAAFHVPPQEGKATHYLGHMLVVPRRHVDHLPDLSADEAATVMSLAYRLSRALRAARNPQRIHLAVVGLNVPHFHLHVYPRYPGTPNELDWQSADEWEGAPHGDAAEIAALADELRAGLY